VRQWHRRISLVVGVFMLFIALTGALLQGETMLAGRGNAGGPPAGMRAPAAVSDDEVRALLATSLAGARRLSAGTLMGIELRLVGTPTAEVVVAEPALRKLRLDARTGAPLDASSQPGRRDLHAVLLDLHRGEFAGSAGLWASLACGVALTVLSATGLTVYLQAWRRRRAAGQPGFFW
jgi:hypothetical protein